MAKIYEKSFTFQKTAFIVLLLAACALARPDVSHLGGGDGYDYQPGQPSFDLPSEYLPPQEDEPTQEYLPPPQPQSSIFLFVLYAIVLIDLNLFRLQERCSSSSSSSRIPSTKTVSYSIYSVFFLLINLSWHQQTSSTTSSGPSSEAPTVSCLLKQL